MNRTNVSGNKSPLPPYVPPEQSGKILLIQLTMKKRINQAWRNTRGRLVLISLTHILAPTYHYPNLSRVLYPPYRDRIQDIPTNFQTVPPGLNQIGLDLIVVKRQREIGRRPEKIQSKNEWNFLQEGVKTFYISTYLSHCEKQQDFEFLTFSV